MMHTSYDYNRDQNYDAFEYYGFVDIDDNDLVVDGEENLPEE